MDAAYEAIMARVSAGSSPVLDRFLPGRRPSACPGSERRAFPGDLWDELLPADNRV
jgi:hypothetical protein